MQVILTSHGPRLVELAVRCHGGAGSWLPLAEECIGYTQIEATLNCYLRPDSFDTLPAEPVLLKHGLEGFLVSQVEGPVRSIPGLDQLRRFPSFR